MSRASSPGNSDDDLADHDALLPPSTKKLSSRSSSYADIRLRKMPAWTPTSETRALIPNPVLDADGVPIETAA